MEAAVARRTLPAWLIPALGGAGVLALWWGAASSGLLPKAYVPPPGAVAGSVRDVLASGEFVGDLEASMFRVLVAFLLSAALAIPIACLAGVSQRFHTATMPFFGFLRYTPVAAFIPLCILWIGIGESEKIAVIFIGTFFQLVMLLTDAVRAVPKAYIQVARVLGGTRWQVVRDIVLPSSASAGYDALRVALGWAWSYVVLAELVAASSGVGYRLVEAQRYLRTDKVFAGILLIGGVGLLLDLALAYVKPLLFPWEDKR